MIDTPSLPDLARPILALAEEAGREILRVQRHEELEVTAKADQSPLTLADRRAHQIITAGLAELTPQIPVLSEEGTHADPAERAAWPELWVVDPLDGTKEFVAGRDEFTVNIALIRAGVPVLGVVVAPALDESFVGWAPAGDSHRVPAVSRAAFARRGGGQLEPIGGEPRRETPRRESPRETGDRRTSETVWVVASKSHLNQATSDFIDRLEARLAAESPLRRLERVSFGSSLKLCRLADGSAQIYPRFAPTMEWDTAAGHAVLRGAGGECFAVPIYPSAEPLCYNKADLHNPHFVAVGRAGMDLVRA